MNEITLQAEYLLEQSQELLKHPEIRGAVSGYLSWIGRKIFTDKKASQEKLEQIEQQKAEAQTISDLKANLKFMLDGNDSLQKELAEKVKEVDLLLKQAGVQATKKNTANSTGKNKVYQDIHGDINDNSTSQTDFETGHNIGGDYVAGDIISGNKTSKE